MHLFRDSGYIAAMISLALGASVYYSQAIIWPQMTANVYAQGRPIWAGWVSSLVGIGITVGVSLSRPSCTIRHDCVPILMLRRK